MKFIIDNSPFAENIGSMYYFDNIKELNNKIKCMLMGAENNIRESLGVPKIGEGWVSETEMVNLAIRKEHQDVVNSLNEKLDEHYAQEHGKGINE